MVGRIGSMLAPQTPLLVRTELPMRARPANSLPLSLPGQVLHLRPADPVRYLRPDQWLPDPGLSRDGGQGASNDH